MPGDVHAAFPVLGHRKSWVPWSFVEQFRAQAMANHGQTLERLAERGGLSYTEMYACLTGVNPFSASAPKIVERCAEGAIHRVFSRLLQHDRENLDPEVLRQFYAEAETDNAR